MILRLFRKDPIRQSAETLYVRIVEAARNPAYFIDLGVADDPEGRFEVLSAHVALVLRRLKAAGEPARAFAQALFDSFFRNLDDQLREMGVGDLTVGKKIRGLAEAFYGRTGVYDEALTAGDANRLASAVARNVFAVPADEPVPPGAIAFADFMMRSDALLAAQEIDALTGGQASFAAICADLNVAAAPGDAAGEGA